MARTFRYHISALNCLVVVFIAAAAVLFFIGGSVGNVLVGVLLTLIGLSAVERMIGTLYTFTDDGLLVVKRGRIARQITIPVNEVLKAEKVRGRLLPVRFVLIEYGASHFTSVQTADEDAFIGELRERQRAFDLTLNDDEKK